MSNEENKTEDFQGDVNENTSNETPKVGPYKKTNKKLIGIIVACIAVVAIACVAVFAGPKIISVISGNNLSPDERLQTAVTNLKDKLAAEYDKAEAPIAEELSNISGSGTFTVKLGDTIMAMLPKEYANLSDLSGKFTSNVKDDAQASSFTIDVAGTQLVSLNAISKDNSHWYLQIPELSKNYLTLDMASSGVTVPDYKEFTKKLTDKESIKSLINSSFDIIDQYINDVTVEKKAKVTVKDTECTYDKLTLTLTGEQLKNFSKEFTTALYNEPVVSALLEYLKTTFTQVGQSIPDLSLDELLKQIDASEVSADSKVTYHFYLNTDNKIKGLDVIAYEGEAATNELSFMLAGDEAKTFVVTCKENDQIVFDLSCDYTKKDGICNGSLTGTTYTEGVADNDFTVQFTDLLMGNTNVKGTFVISASALQGAEIILGLDYGKNSGKFDLSVAMAGSSVIDASFDITTAHEAVIPEIDSSVKTFDAATEYQNYLGESDLMGFIQKITEVTGIDIMSLLQGSMGN